MLTGFSLEAWRLYQAVGRGYGATSVAEFYALPALWVEIVDTIRAAEAKQPTPKSEPPEVRIGQ